MADDNPDLHLSRIVTLWALVKEAHHGDRLAVRDAQRRLIDQYGSAVRRYLRGALKDPEAADEVFQEFAYRLLHGDLRGADPGRGRFRDFVKGVLFHLIAAYHRRKQTGPRQLVEGMPEPAVEPDPMDQADEEFLASWRQELLAKAWTALEQAERSSGRPLYTVLRFRADHPDLPSPRLAEELSARLGKPLSAAGVRQTLHRAREQFGSLLLDAVRESLEKGDPERVEEELIELGLLEYCRPALERKRDEG